jgi:hypothetical protein
MESIEVIEVIEPREDVEADEASVERRLLGRRGGGRARDGSVRARGGGGASEYGGGGGGGLASIVAVWEEGAYGRGHWRGTEEVYDVRRRCTTQRVCSGCARFIVYRIDYGSVLSYPVARVKQQSAVISRG